MKLALRIIVIAGTSLLFWLPVQLYSVDVAWDQTNGPLGGVVSKLLTIDSEPLASLYSGGLYNLQDSTWEQTGIGYGLPENRVFDMVVDPRDHNRIYAGLMIACGATSTDGGDNWTGWCDNLLSDLGIDNFSTDTLLLDPTNPDIIYAFGRDNTSAGQLLRSPDQGASWEVWATFANEAYFNHSVAFNDKFYLATRSNGILVSDDLGITWSALNDGLTETETTRFAIDETNNELYLVSGLFRFNIRTGGRLYQLSASGATWEPLGGPELATGIAWYEDELWVGTYTGEVWRGNNGASLQLRNADDRLPNSVAEFGFTSTTVLAGLSGTGIYRSTDNGQTFTANNRGLKSMAMRQIAVDPNNRKHYYGVTWDRFGIYTTKNSGNSYQVIAPDNYFLVIAPDPQNFKHIYAGGGNFFYDITVKRGADDIAVLDEPGPADDDITALAIHPNNNAILLAGLSDAVESTAGHGVYRSTDAGRSWKKTKGLPKVGVHSIIYHPNNPKIVYAAAFGAGVYKSTNGGKRWSKLIGGDQLKYVYRLAMSPSDPKILLAGSQLFFAGLSTADQTSGQYGGVYKTTDAGRTWSEITASIRDYGDNGETEVEGWKYNFGHLPNYEEMLIDPNNADVMMIGHHGENVIVTTDNGATWSKPVSGMIPNEIHNYAYCLGAAADFTTIYSCTCGRGMFKGSFNESTQSFAWDESTPFAPADAAPLLTPAAARTRALSGEDNHEHTPLIQ